MNVKQRLRKLEKAMLERLAAAAAETAVSIAEGPPLTETEARRLDLHSLLALVEAELHPSKVRKGVAFGRHFARFRRMPLMPLYRLYKALKRRLIKVQSRRRGTLRKGSDEYYQFLRNIYGEMTQEARRAEREALYPEPPLVPEFSHQTSFETNYDIKPPAPPSQWAWAVA